MAVNPTKLFDGLAKLVQSEDKANFIYGFLRLFDTPKATITKLQNQTPGTNVADMPLHGEIALSRKLYFKPVAPDADIYDVLQDLKQSATADKNKIRFFIVTDFQNIAAYDIQADDYLECAYTDLAQNYGFFLPLAGLEKAADLKKILPTPKPPKKWGVFSTKSATTTISKNPKTSMPSMSS